MGDINGDSVDDIVVGAYFYNTDRLGACFIFFGRVVTSTSTAFKNVNVATFAFTAATGFKVLGSLPTVFQNIGWSASKAGDVNGDGIADLIFSGEYATTAYVLFGRNVTKTKQPFSNMYMNNWVTNYTTGFRLVSNQSVITSVSCAGDINGDGVSDVIVGAPYVGKSYIVFGRAVTTLL